MKRALLFIALALGACLAVIAYRAANGFPAGQPEPLRAPEAAAPDAAGAARRLSRAITIPTVSYDDRSRFDAEAFRDFHAFLETSYPRVHALAERHVVNDYSLVYRFPGTDPALEPVLFMGHFDVVPVDPASRDAWRYDPFGGVVADGAVWGRGSMDDKLGVIALLEAAEQLLAENTLRRRAFYLAFGHDEEVGGQDGARRVAEWFADQGIRFEFVLDEGGVVTEGIFEDIDAPVAVIGVAEKGWINLRLTVRDAGGHSSQPPNHTAVGILSQAIVRLEANPFPPTLEFTRMTIGAVAAALPWRIRALFANTWLFEPLLTRALLADPGGAASLRTTTAATMVSGSPKSNILPTRADAVVNFRIIPGETAESVRARAAEVIDDERVEIAIETFWNPSPVSPTDSEAYRLIAGTIRGLAPGVLVAPYLVRGGTDARYFYPLSDSVYRFMMARADPQTIERVHGIDEHVSVADLVEAARFYRALMNRVVRGTALTDT